MMQVPFGGYPGFFQPNTPFWQNIPRNDGDGTRPAGIMGRGLAPRGDSAAGLLGAQVPQPNIGGAEFSDPQWLALMQYLQGGGGLNAGLLGQNPQQPQQMRGLLGGNY